MVRPPLLDIFWVWMGNTPLIISLNVTFWLVAWCKISLLSQHVFKGGLINHGCACHSGVMRYCCTSHGIYSSWNQIKNLSLISSDLNSECVGNVLDSLGGFWGLVNFLMAFCCCSNHLIVLEHNLSSCI